MGSIAQDKMGNIALGYSKSGQTCTLNYVTGRVPADPLGQMEGEVELYAGTDPKRPKSMGRLLQLGD